MDESLQRLRRGRYSGTQQRLILAFGRAEVAFAKGAFRDGSWVCFFCFVHEIPAESSTSHRCQCIVRRNDPVFGYSLESLQNEAGATERERERE